MDIVNVSIWLWKHTANRYASKQLAEEIENIHERITNVYSDIANAHFGAAHDAILAIEHSKSPVSEIRAAIGHLREAFNIYQSVIDRKEAKHYWIFFKDEEYVVKNRSELYQCLAYLSALISIMYSSLQEPENAFRWKKKSSEAFLTYLEFVTFKPEELKKLDNRFVVETEDSWELSSFGDMPGAAGTSHSIEITEAGNQYIKKWKSDVHKQFLEGLDHRTLVVKI